VGRQLQGALTNEVELVKHGELVAELVKLHQHDRRRESHRGSLSELGLGMGHGVAYANVQDEQQPASWLCMLHGTWGCRWGTFSQ
jgi:hypothetical protein